MDANKLAQRPEDVISKSLLPLGFKDLRPITSTDDGNCLFNAVSIALTGDESLAVILWLLTVPELLAYSEFYSQHPQLASASQASGYSVSAILIIFLSNEKAEEVYNGNINNFPVRSRFWLKRQLNHLSTPDNFTFWCSHQLLADRLSHFTPTSQHLHALRRQFMVHVILERSSKHQIATMNMSPCWCYLLCGQKRFVLQFIVGNPTILYL